ncbi:PH domain-containing protein [Nocardioidaceae bacterium]|nr:PH domain-containing protein [Nocardioidaceae bacterium]
MSRRSQARSSPSDEPESPDELDAVDGSAATWQRTSPLQLVVAPARALANLALPFVVVLFLGSGGGGRSLIGTLAFIVPVAILVVLGSLLPWLGTRWRIADGRLQQKYRVLSTKQTSVTLDRVRSVDLESTIWHRALGLSVVKIGTGVDDERITLDSLAKSDALELQEFLLTRVDRSAAYADADRPEGSDAQPSTPPRPAGREVLTRLDWSWLRYAPLQVSQLVVLAAAFGFFAQFLDDLPIDQGDVVDSVQGQVDRLGLLIVIGFVLVVVVVGYVLAAIGAYAVRWYGLVVSRDPENLRVEAGLLTTRSVTVERRRIRGLEMTEPALVRLATGAQLSALATGVGSGGTTQVLPSVPRAVAVDVGEQMLDAREALTTELTQHGPAARRRRHVRAQLVAVPAAAALVVATVLADLTPALFVLAALLPVLGVGLAELSYKHLGHTLTPTHLVSRTGILGTTTRVLERDGVIGWTLTQTFFQRRVGLCHLVAATAAGPEQVAVVDVRLDVATALAAEITPRLVRQFAA